MLKHLVVISDDAVASGGAAMVALQSARMVRSRGFRVTLLSAESLRDPALLQEGIEGETLGGQHLLEGPRARSAVRGLWDRDVSARLAAWIRSNDEPGTIYHVHNWHKALSPSALAALRPVSSRLVLSAHDFFLACPNGGFYHYPADQPCELRPMSAACLMSNCDKRHRGHKVWRVLRHMVRRGAIDLSRCGATVLAVHEGMLALLERGGIPRNAMRVLRNPVSPWVPQRVDAARNTTILYVGRLELDKGVDVLAAAARRASASVCMIGDGSLRGELAASSPELKLAGRLDHREIAALAAQARLVVVPTRVRETFSLVAIEALLSGLPVIVTSTAMLGSELDQLGIARVVPPGDVEALARAMTHLAADDALIDGMSRRAHVVAPGLAPTHEVWCDGLLALYREKLACTAV